MVFSCHIHGILNYNENILLHRFLYNADTQRSLTRNGETLLAALHFFNNSLNTLTNKTIEDTLLTIRQYEAARWVTFIEITDKTLV